VYGWGGDARNKPFLMGRWRLGGGFAGKMCIVFSRYEGALGDGGGWAGRLFDSVVVVVIAIPD
jgi:hypothetical protein